ncbi:hypothetical protein PCANB_002024 [Pneumocystis canis]|nr:hypothetical protein PCANB_002024 [Pneumocystis canis]
MNYIFHLFQKSVKIRYQKKYSTGISCFEKDPLRILFFGTDYFSTFSLLSLISLFQSNKTILEKIEVVTLSDSKIGRGGKTFYRTPVKSLALKHNLKIYEVENGNMQEISNIVSDYKKMFNLVVVASFGHLIPYTILKNVKYGGINVHPSFLPRHKGPAPLHHTLLNRDTYTGVTIQTLHPYKFDEGRIISVSEPYKISEKETFQTLSQTLAKMGAELLIHVLLKQKYLNFDLNIQNPYEYSYARKLTKEDRIIKWNLWTSTEIELRNRVFGKLQCKSKSLDKIVILGDIEMVDDTEEKIYGCSGLYVYSNDCLHVRCVDGRNLKIGKIKIEGKNWVDGKEWSKTCLIGKCGYFI